MRFVILAFALTGCAMEARAPQARESDPAVTAPDLSRGTHVVLLGTGNPNPDTARFGPAVAIVVNGEPYLVDAGVGIVRRAAAAGIPVPKLRRVFLTHLHSDHTIGMADLLLTPWVLERTEPLEVYGPTGADAMMSHLTMAYDADIRNRIDGLQPQNPSGWRSEVHRVQPGEVYRDSLVTVTAIPVPHADWAEAWGYRFETADRVIVVSGDTRYSEALIAACNGCDVLVHEVYSDAGFARRTPEWQAYHGQAHTGAADLGRLATAARPGLLLLYHQMLMGATEADLLAEIRATFAGRVVSGRDLGVY
ncbi:MAG: MBL fold metallo-hydrolase [Gemmatimonadota bacterium]|nr:MBL fold metallo-hydrolase [Gemmatimonadota bacterium]